MNIKTKYDPKHPKHKNEKQVDTNDYSDEQLVEIVVSIHNKDYSGTEKKQLLQEIHERINHDWFSLFLMCNTALLLDLSRLIDKVKLRYNPLKVAAQKYLERLDFVLQHNPLQYYFSESDSELDRFFLAKSLGGKVSKDLLDVMLMANKSREDRRSFEERKLLKEKGQQLLQLAVYFGSEIPNKGDFFKVRNKFLKKLQEKASQLGLYDEDPRNISQKLLDRMLKEIVEDADKIVILVNKSALAFIPTTFEESLSTSMRLRIGDLRKRLNIIMRPFIVQIRDLIPSAKLKYRGSLTDGIKNLTKSQPITVTEQSVGLKFGKKAVSVNILAFDVDAFIEVSDNVWKQWDDNKLIPDRKDQAIKGKLILEDWIKMLEGLVKNGNQEALKVLPTARFLRELEIQLQQELCLLEGYKKIGKQAEFELVIQPKKKTEKSITYGRPYPLGELSRGGSAYQELKGELKQIKEDGIDEFGSWIKETNIEIKEEGMLLKWAQIALHCPWRALTRLDLVGLSKEVVKGFLNAIRCGFLPYLVEMRVERDLIEPRQLLTITECIPVRIQFHTGKLPSLIERPISSSNAIVAVQGSGPRLLSAERLLLRKNICHVLDVSPYLGIEAINKTYNKWLLRNHPDLTTDEEEKLRRHKIVTELKQLIVHLDQTEKLMANGQHFALPSLQPLLMIEDQKEKL